MNITKLIKNYFSFSKQEITSILLLSLSAAFMYSINDWGPDQTVVITYGLFNLFNAFLICLVAILIHESAHKIYALSRGYVSEHKPWWISVAIGFFATLLASGFSGGNGRFFIVGFGVVVYHLSAERLGKFRYGLNLKDLGLISAMGPLANIVLAVFFKAMFLLTQSPLAEKAFEINMIFAVTNIMPLPWLDGGNLFYAGRTMYVFFAAFIIALAVTLYIAQSVLVPIIISIVVAVALAIFWALFVEEAL